MVSSSWDRCPYLDFLDTSRLARQALFSTSVKLQHEFNVKEE